MKFLPNIFSIFQKSKKESFYLTLSDMTAVDALFSFLLAQFRSTESSRDIFSQYDKVRKLPEDHREQLLILLYFTLEALLIKSKPPAITREFTITSLRREILTHVKTQGLSHYFRLVFLPEVEQTIMLAVLSLQNILVKSGLKQLPTSVTRETILEGLPVSQEILNLNNLLAKLKNNSLGEVTSNFRALYYNVSQELTNKLGEHASNRLFREAYNLIKSTYSFDIVGLYIDILPRQIFESERLAVLSREELERNVVERTKELSLAKEELEDKVKQIEKQNKELEDTKKAVLNVLEDEKILEEQLKVERDRAQAILSSMGEGLFVVGKDGRIVMINPAAGKILGVNEEFSLKKYWYELLAVYRNDKQLPIEEWPVHKTLISKSPMNINMDDNYYYKKLNGDKFPVTITTAPLLAGDIILGAVIVFKDITRDKEEKKIIEDTVVERTKQLLAKTRDLEAANRQVSESSLLIQQEKAKLRASIDSLTQGFIMIDMQANIVVINPAAMKILAVKEAPANLRQIEEKFSPEAKLQQKHEYCHRDKTPINIPKLTLGGKFLSVFLTPIIVTAPVEKDFGTVILIEDITEAKMLERSRDEFFSIASHELRTPLTAIRGNTSLIKQYYSSEIKNKELMDMIGDIHNSSVRLIDIVNDFLDTSRLELGRIEFKKEKFEVGELITEVINEYKTAEASQILYVNYRPPEQALPKVLADRNRVKQVIINLVSNALKFTEKGGVTIFPQVLDNFVKIHVSDTGRGIAAVNQNLLFRKFQQAGESLLTRDTTRGTGLGLYISKLMVEGMGGFIKLEKSEEGKGSDFSITLPRADTVDTSQNTGQEQEQAKSIPKTGGESAAVTV